MSLVFKLNIFVAVLTITAYLSAYISPQKLWVFGFMAYGIPVFMVLNFIFLILWITKGSMRLLVSLLTIILGLGNIRAFYSISGSSPSPQNQFSVMSYNVNCFNPVPKKGSKDQEAFNKITDYLIEESPDILCIQEYCSYPTIKMFDSKSKLLGSGYKHLIYKTRNREDRLETAGLAVFTKFSLINSGMVAYKGQKIIAVYMDLLISTDTVRIYNTHLFSMGLVNDQQQEASGSVKGFVRRMKNGFQAKSAEAAFLKQHLMDSPYKTILAGDFNETPYSYIYKSFNKGLNNSFEIAGQGLGVTYNGNIPFLRIDHQYADKKIQILRHRVLTEMNITDHFPVVVDYTLE